MDEPRRFQTFPRLPRNGEVRPFAFLPDWPRMGGERLKAPVGATGKMRQDQGQPSSTIPINAIGATPLMRTRCQQHDSDQIPVRFPRSVGKSVIREISHKYAVPISARSTEG